MDLIKLFLVFFLIVATLKLKKPLYVSILTGIAGTSLLYDVGLIQTVQIMGISSISPITITLILAFYSITFLQRMLEKREKSFYWLSKQTGISHTTLWRLKKGKALGINFITLEKICQALECEPGDILRLKSENKKSERLPAFRFFCYACFRCRKIHFHSNHLPR